MEITVRESKNRLEIFQMQQAVQKYFTIVAEPVHNPAKPEYYFADQGKIIFK